MWLLINAAIAEKNIKKEIFYFSFVFNKALQTPNSYYGHQFKRATFFNKQLGK